MTSPIQRTSWYHCALIVSYLLHPVFIPSYIFVVFLYFGTMVFDPYPIIGRTYVTGLIFITTALIPMMMLAINLLLARKKIGNKELLMDSKKDRVVPFFYIGIYYSSLTYMFYSTLHFPLLLTCLMMIISAAVLITACVSIFWKISAHAISLGACIMIFILIYTILPEADFLYVIIATVFLSGITLSSRLYLNAHSPNQVYAGFVLGMFVSCIGLYFLVENLFNFSLPI